MSVDCTCISSQSQCYSSSHCYSQSLCCDQTCSVLQRGCQGRLRNLRLFSYSVPSLRCFVGSLSAAEFLLSSFLQGSAGCGIFCSWPKPFFWTFSTLIGPLKTVIVFDLSLLFLWWPLSHFAHLSLSLFFFHVVQTPIFAPHHAYLKVVKLGQSEVENGLVRGFLLCLLWAVSLYQHLLLLRAVIAFDEAFFCWGPTLTFLWFLHCFWYIVWLPYAQMMCCFTWQWLIVMICYGWIEANVPKVKLSKQQKLGFMWQRWMFGPCFFSVFRIQIWSIE